MTTTTKAARIPLEDLEAIIAAALAQGDYEHDAAWHRPPECPCHDHGRSCLDVQARGGRQACPGYVIEVPTPEPHLVNLAVLTAALPGPDHDGTLDMNQAASSILRVIETRLVPHPYTLRASSLVRRLTEESERYEQAHGMAEAGSAGRQQDPGEWLPKCQWCGEPCNDRRARYCRQAHRQAAYKRRRRDERGG